jgi:hypothetical protein
VETVLALLRRECEVTMKPRGTTTLKALSRSPIAPA